MSTKLFINAFSSLFNKNRDGCLKLSKIVQNEIKNTKLVTKLHNGILIHTGRGTTYQLYSET